MKEPLRLGPVTKGLWMLHAVASAMTWFGVGVMVHGDGDTALCWSLFLFVIAELFRWLSLVSVLAARPTEQADQGER